ncbi:hypothetical protein Ciccas_009923 [Cichlidogyrus casuarinus]|uniref:Neurotransmitter-gated ion-channel ligand-binding domain-containing protein n=1 Tax=Cichlidogyrus casuarinus TaxID=1844966 RepID=A0ABD2PX59_9PLAT
MLFYSSRNSTGLMKVLDQLLRGYDMRIRPKFHSLKDRIPVEVAVSMHVPSISTISEVNMVSLHGLAQDFIGTAV